MHLEGELGRMAVDSGLLHRRPLIDSGHDGRTQGKAHGGGAHESTDRSHGARRCWRRRRRRPRVRLVGSGVGGVGGGISRSSSSGGSGGGGSGGHLLDGGWWRVLQAGGWSMMVLAVLGGSMRSGSASASATAITSATTERPPPGPAGVPGHVGRFQEIAVEGNHAFDFLRDLMAVVVVVVIVVISCNYHGHHHGHHYRWSLVMFSTLPRYLPAVWTGHGLATTTGRHVIGVAVLQTLAAHHVLARREQYGRGDHGAHGAVLWVRWGEEGRWRWGGR